MTKFSSPTELALCYMRNIGRKNVKLFSESLYNDSFIVCSNAESSTEVPPRKTSLLARPFGFGWLDKNKVAFFDNFSKFAFTNVRILSIFAWYG